MSAGFTQGPWSAEGITQVATNNGHYAIQSESGVEVVRTSPMRLVDARLIAAAPDLLHALDYLLEQTVDMDRNYGIELTEGEADARHVALEAIAKAHGETYERDEEDDR